MLPAVVVYGGGNFYAFSVTHSSHVLVAGVLCVCACWSSLLGVAHNS